MFGSVDYAVVGLYGCLVAYLGYIAKRRVKNLDDYFTGGRKVPWWMAAVSHHVSGYSAFMFVGMAGLTYKAGLSAWTYFAVLVPPGLVLGAFLWAPRWSKLNVSTAVELLERRFNLSVRLACGISGILVKFADEGIKLYSLALAIKLCTGWPLPFVIVGCGIITLLYVSLGGLWATMLTDFAQFFVQGAITIILAIVVLIHVGGWRPIYDNFTPDQARFFSAGHVIETTPWFLMVFLSVFILSYNGGTWGLAQRFYSIGRPKDAKKACLLSSGLYLVYPLVIFIPIWSADIVGVEVANPEESYVLVAQRFLGDLAPGLMGLFVSAMFAATMSMIDSDINAIAAVFTKDIYQRTISPKSSERALFRVGLISTIVFGTITIGSALWVTKSKEELRAFKVMVEWYAAMLGPISIPLLFGMLLKRPTWRGALGALVFGLLAFASVKYGAPYLGRHGVAPFEGVEKVPSYIYTGVELLVSFSVILIEGYIFKHTPEEQEKVDTFFAQLESDSP